jgi:hypothetical protein
MASFGETLKRQRELREISLRQISEATKINIRYLEALEQNHFEILPGGLFNKGFIRAYAAYVGLDGEAMVNSYLSELAAHDRGPVPAAGDPGRPHRPADLPPRRAAAGREPAAPAITFAAGPAPAPAPERLPAGAAVTPRVTHYETQRPPAITQITEAAAAAPTAASPRALLWILAAVVGAGVVLLVLSLLSGPKPATVQPPQAPDADPGGDSGVLSAGPAEAIASDDVLAGKSPDGPARPPADPGGPPAASGGPPSGPPAGTDSREAAPREAPRRAAVAGLGLPPSGAAVPGPARPGRDSGTVAASPAGPMALEVEARWPTWVQVTCDGRDVIERQMSAGEVESVACRSFIRVSATDAGAVRLRVDEAPCLPLGDPGARVYGYTIRIDDFHRICRPQRRGDHGRP